jgi:transposase-like protein
VQIDESKFGKRKYNRGHHVDGVWVVGGVEKTPERKVFLAVVPQRNAETLESIIKHYVKPGSLIYTDCWRGYSQLNELEDQSFEHHAVNHQETFITNEGVNTNTIEGTWNGIKLNISPRLRNKKEMPWKLVEFIWRRKHHNNEWNAITHCLREISFDDYDDCDYVRHSYLTEFF